MSDDSVATALRSGAQLVVVEAPAGCGKTYQAAEYASWLTDLLLTGKILILTHTHAACDAFRSRTEGAKNRVYVTTIDGLISHIASIYHLSLDLPRDTAAWAFAQGGDGFQQLAEKVVELLSASHAVTQALVRRYPYILCDEHQDANAFQHAVVMRLLAAGARVRIFGDPMQAIFLRSPMCAQHDAWWAALQLQAERAETLDTPHRWATGSPRLGAWILEAREALRNGGAIDVRRELPRGLTLITAENISPLHGGFQLEMAVGRNINRIIDNADPLMILSTQNALVRGVNGYLRGRVPIWEGHTREALQLLVCECSAAAGSPDAVAAAFRRFVQTCCKGFSNSGFANRLVLEVAGRAATRCRGKPAQLQELARLLIESPDHRGVSNALIQLNALANTQDAFREIRIDLQREYREAIRLGSFEDASDGFAELNRRRSMVRSHMPSRFVSTVHKAKGLESPNVLLMPCDQSSFPDSAEKRCLLYVALSRASSSVTIAVSSVNSSRLFIGA